MGITAGEVDRIFERFHRVSSSMGVEGSGLGLSIVGAIATAHGGTVDVQSEAGIGSTFTIVLPQPNGGAVDGPAHDVDARSGS